MTTSFKDTALLQMQEPFYPPFPTPSPPSLNFPPFSTLSSNQNQPPKKYYNFAKAKKLRQLALSVLNDPQHSKELTILMWKLDLSVEDVLKAYINYDMDIYANTNDIYYSKITQFVMHMHNFLKDSWHVSKQKIILDFINLIKPRSIADLGFGTPANYVKTLLQTGNTKITLGDISDSAIAFAEDLLNLWDKNWQNIVTLKQMNIEEDFIGPYDLYMFRDSLEHTIKPEAFLEKYIKLAPANATFLLSLPIGPLTPEHYISWESADQITDWLKERNLTIIFREIIKVNPKVDLFAEQHNFFYKDFIALCTCI